MSLLLIKPIKSFKLMGVPCSRLKAYIYLSCFIFGCVSINVFFIFFLYQDNFLETLFCPVDFQWGAPLLLKASLCAGAGES